ncbi:MAG: endolytic transglycosylase MltG [Candidatus Doudnabacteria bacterium]
MFARLFIFTALILALLGGFGLLQAYQSYQSKRAYQAEQLNKKAEEVKVTILEGWTLVEVAQELEEKGLFSSEDFLSAAQKFDTSTYALLDKPDSSSLEGYLFPDTYQFAKQSTPELVIDKMLQNFAKRLNSIGVTQSDQDFTIPNYGNLNITGADREPGISLYDVITLASIIERESGGNGSVDGPLSLNEERRLVASVFYNRLEIGQALESDATVNYITGKKTPGVSLNDTEVNSPYNTYKYPGMPPGPIGNPSLGSIEAALRPASSDYLYFLHKQPSGLVDFSKTFPEHVSKK